MRVIGITPINNDLKEEKSMKFLQKLGKNIIVWKLRTQTQKR